MDACAQSVLRIRRRDDAQKLEQQQQQPVAAVATAVAAAAGGIAAAGDNGEDSGCQEPQLPITTTNTTTNTRKRRKLCSLGSGEVVFIMHYEARGGCVDDFEAVVQRISRSLYHMETSVTDVRVCHPQCGQVCFVLTFLSRQCLALFKRGPFTEINTALRDLVVGSKAQFSTSGSLMPVVHTLPTLLE